MTMTTDFGPFDRSFASLAKHATRKGGILAMAQAGTLFLRDMLFEEPTIPLDEGTMRGAGTVFVGNVVKATSLDLGFPMILDDEGFGRPALTLGIPAVPHEIMATIGINVPYAEVHERGERFDGTYKIKNYSHSGTGAGFMRKRLEEADIYFEAAADALNDELKNWTRASLR